MNQRAQRKRIENLFGQLEDSATTFAKNLRKEVNEIREWPDDHALPSYKIGWVGTCLHSLSYDAFKIESLIRQLHSGASENHRCECFQCILARKN